MRASDRYEIEIALSDIRDCLSHAQWSWDENRQSVSARLGQAEWKQAEKRFRRVFPLACRSGRQASRIPVAESIVRLHGGLREGQKIWISDPGRSSGAWALWAPWADGENSTLFLGVWSSEDDDDRMLRSSIRRIFGIH